LRMAYRSRASVQRSARATVNLLAEYARAFEGGAGRDIRAEGFVGAGVGQPGSPLPTVPGGPRPAGGAGRILVLLVIVALIAGG
jgi:hypothetical protein